MKTPGFFEGVLIALLISIIASIGMAVLPGNVGTALSLKLVITLITLGYTLYLLRRSKERVGRIVTVTAMGGAFAALWLWNPPLLTYSLANACIIWLIRSLYFHGSLFTSITDFILTLLGFSAAIWALSHTESLFLSVWCFFLVQSLFPLLPSPGQKKGETLSTESQAFNKAHQIAETAIRQLSNHRI